MYLTKINRLNTYSSLQIANFDVLNGTFIYMTAGRLVS